MVHRCCISSCKMNVRVAEAKGLSYHCFPLKDPHREKWIQAILPHVDKPENFKIVQGYTRVCSRHFRIKEYSIDSKKRARLNSNAVPSVFPRKNAPLFIQPPIIIAAAAATTTTTTTATKSQISNMKTPMSTSDDPKVETSSPSSRKQSRSKAEDIIKSQQQQQKVHDKSQIVEPKTPTNSAHNSTVVTDSKNLLTFKEPSAVDPLVEGVQQQQQQQPAEEDQHHSSDVSLDEKQDQTKRKRRKWNRTAFARNSKSKQKKSSASPTAPAVNHHEEDDDDDDDLNDFATHLIALTRSNSLDLEQQPTAATELHDNSLGLSSTTTTTITNCLQQSTSSSSSLSMSDPLQTVEDLNNLIMSVEEQELLQSIQAVSLDCGEGEMSLNMKNIHLDGDHLDHEGLLKKVSSLIDTNGPILLEDALISSASEMSLQPKVKEEERNFPMRTPSASEIEKLACEFSSSLLTSVSNLPIHLLDDGDSDDDDDDPGAQLRLPVSGFPNQSSINIDLPENVLVSDGEAPPTKMQPTPSKFSSKNNNNSSSSNNNKKSSGSSIPKKKLVGIQKKPKNNDKCFGKFSVERFCDSDKDIEYYTGFPTFSHFEAFFNSLQSHVEKLKVTDVMHGVADLADLIRNQNIVEGSSSSGGSPSKDNDNNVTSWNEESSKRRAIIGRSMSRIDELFMTLIRLKRRLPEKVLGHMFFVSQPTVSRTIRAWTVLLSKLLEPIPSVSTEQPSLPETSTSSSKSKSKTPPEQNYFTSRGIYIPDSFRQLFQSDLATSIISSAQNPRNSLTSSSSSVLCSMTPTTIVKIIATNNNINNNNNNVNNKKGTCLLTTAADHSRCKCEGFPCSCGVVGGDFDDGPPFVMEPCSEADIHNEFYQWGLIVKEG